MKVKSILEKLKEKKRAITAGFATAVSAAVMAVGASAEALEVPQIADNLTTADFKGILDQMTSLVPIVLPVIVACLAFRKGISFLRGMIAGA